MAENTQLSSDERLKKSPGTITRGSRDTADSDRIEKDGTAVSMQERKRLIREEWNQEILPTPPALDGWHTCWLSTTNSADPIRLRVRMGYVPVKLSECPGFEQYKVTSGEFDGCVACNEMILFKIEEEIFQDLMLHRHHELPLEMESEIREQVDSHQQNDRRGQRLVESEGFDVLGKRVRAPTHF